jgi:selenocysteine lyase/cysteine desulfurase
VIVSPRVGSARFSMHFYNSSDDVERALTTLDEVPR